MTFDPQQYIDDYKKAHYDRVVLFVPKGAKAELREYAKVNDLSLNALILKAIERQYNFNFEDYKKGAAE